MSTLRVPDILPSPIQDSERLRKAFKGWGTDEKAVTSVLGHRLPVREGRSEKLMTRLPRNLWLVGFKTSSLVITRQKAVVLWTLDPPERDAKMINRVLHQEKNSVGQLQVIIEIACATSPNYLMSVRRAYLSLFDCSLEEDIVSNVTALPLRKLLVVGLVSSYRYYGEVFDKAVMELDAVNLHDAIQGKKSDEEELFYIFSTRSVCQLRATFELYKHNYGNSIDQDIKSCGEGDLESILQVVVWCIDRPERHFAEVVRSAVTGFGTDEDSLTRVIVTCAEIDMMKIRGEYYNLYSTSLDSDITGDTSGDYEDFLLTLLGANL